MKNFDVFFLIKGPARTTEAPCTSNPVEGESMEELLSMLSKNLPPLFGGVRVIGVRIEEVS